MGLQIERTEFKGWHEASQICLGDVRMVVVAKIGPRVLSLLSG